MPWTTRDVEMVSLAALNEWMEVEFPKLPHKKSTNRLMKIEVTVTYQCSGKDKRSEGARKIILWMLATRISRNRKIH